MAKKISISAQIKKLKSDLEYHQVMLEVEIKGIVRSVERIREIKKEIEVLENGREGNTGSAAESANT